MRNQKILKEYSIKSNQHEDPKLELEKRLREKVSEASLLIDTLVLEFANECNKVITELKEKENILELRYKEEIDKLNKFHVEQKGVFDKKVGTYFEKKNKELEDYKASINTELSTSLGLIVEKVLKHEFKKTSTIESIIEHYINELPDATSTMISLNNESYDSITGTPSDKYLKLKESGVMFKKHSNDDILVDIKTDIGCVVVNKKEQIEEVLELIHDFK